MNQQSSTDISASSNVAPDVISRRAYELWESEGRPEGCDLKHWLQAEQELASPRSNQPQMPARNSDIAPLQGTRAGAAVSATASRENGMKRPPTSATNPGVATASSQTAARKKPATAPAL